MLYTVYNIFIQSVKFYNKLRKNGYSFILGESLLGIGETCL